jgi:hypothetical protein
MKSISLLLVALLFAATTVASAQTGTMMTITLNVPVQISNYGGSRAAVWCELLNVAGKPLALPLGRNGESYGVGVGYVTINGGAASTTLPVSMSVPREATPQVAGWRCILATTDTRVPDPRFPGVNAIPADLAPLVQASGRF